jgi:hypothetical protein
VIAVVIPTLGREECQRGEESAVAGDYIWVNGAAAGDITRFALHVVHKVHLRGLSASACLSFPCSPPNIPKASFTVLDVSSPPSPQQVFVIMSDSVAGLLLELYEMNRATAYSNLLVGIVFGEQLLGVVANTLLTILPPKKTSNIMPINLASSSTPFCLPGVYVVLYGTSLYVLL